MNTVQSMVAEWKLLAQDIQDQELTMSPTLFKGFVASASMEWTHIPSISLDYFITNQIESDQQQKLKLEALCLLAVAIKAHYFLFKNDVISISPRFISIPDLNKPNEPRLAIVYSLNKSEKSIVVSKADLSLLSTGKLALIKFPVVLSSPKQPNHWVDLKYWGKLEKDGAWLQAIRHRLTSKERVDIQSWTSPSDFPFGCVFQSLSESGVKALKECGGRWASGLQMWYLPRGFDIPPVMDYIKAIEKSRSEIQIFNDNVFKIQEND